MIGAQSGVINSVGDGKAIMGAPAIDANIGRRAYSMLKYLPDMRKSIRQLEKEVERLQKALDSANNKSK
jgi:UDP-3-O-[3-hydroxymyristoyl] glucosamine N-acyltransferase